jgi:hypothetical protein
MNHHDELIRLGHQQRFQRLLDWELEGSVSEEERTALVSLAWTGDENPGRHEEAWLQLFLLSGYTSDTDERLSGDLVIFRGTSRVEERPGMAWTLDADCARRFADRSALMFGGNPTVYRARIAADDVLGYFVGRNESEVVVNPTKPMDVGIVQDS